MIKSIDCSELKSIVCFLINNGGDNLTELANNFSLRKIDEKNVIIHGCKFDVSAVIYNSYSSDQAISDWNDISHNIPLIGLSRLLLFNTLYKYIIVKDHGLVDVNNDIQLSNKAPDIIILLSLCYWIKRCQKSIDINNFNAKFNELKDSIQIENVTHDLLHITNTVNILKNTSLPEKIREKISRNMIADIQGWIKIIISFLSEFVICALIKEKQFDVEFISSTPHTKRCDLLVNSTSIEIKSLIDDFRYGEEVEDTLEKELLGTLCREKAKDQLNDSLLKENLGVVILYVVSTSLGMGMAKYDEKEDNFKDVLNKAIDFATDNKFEKSLLLPVIVFSYYINDIVSEFRTSSRFVKYPLNYKYEVDSKKLPIDMI